jgi:hypothetical protein
MILYVNGDSHSCGHDAGGPENSYGRHVADALGWEFVCDAEPAVGNDRIIRRTKEYLTHTRPDFIIIGWSTWEREEWIHNGSSYHVTASGADDVPDELKTKYKEWVIKYADKENQRQKENQNYNKIWDFHIELLTQNIPHLFFNTFSWFMYRLGYDENIYGKRMDYGSYYVDPYNQNTTYYFWLKNNGFDLVNPKWHHYDAEAHKAWANFILPKVKDVLTINA